RDELGGAKAQRQTAAMTFMMLGRALELFTRRLLQIFRLQAASKYRSIAFAREGSSLDRCLPVNNHRATDPVPRSYVRGSRARPCGKFGTNLPVLRCGSLCGMG